MTVSDHGSVPSATFGDADERLGSDWTLRGADPPAAWPYGHAGILARLFHRNAADRDAAAGSAPSDAYRPVRPENHDGGTVRRSRFSLVSVVVPARNEAGNLPILVDEIRAALAHRDHEIIIVDDGSTDDTGLVLSGLRAAGHPVRHVRHDRSCGQSRAIRTGAAVARGDVVATVDGDGQNDPRFIPDLVELLEASDMRTALAAGQRTRRTDSAMKQAASALANGLRSAMLNDGTRDTGCGLKAVPTEVLRLLPYFEGWHRYLPALVLREGLVVVHLDVVDRNRRFGRSNYGIFDRALVGVMDLWGVWWLLRRGRRRPAVTEL